MIRQCCLGSLVAGLIATLAHAAPAPGAASKALGNLLKVKAQRLFELSDQNHDQLLDREEQTDAEQRMEKVFHQLAREQMLGSPKRTPPQVAEFQPIDPERITAAEFEQRVFARAATFDADLRARRLVKYQTPAAPQAVVVMTSITNRNINRRYPNDRDDWYTRPHHHPHHSHLFAPAAQPSPHVSGRAQSPASYPSAQVRMVSWQEDFGRRESSHHSHSFGSQGAAAGHHVSHGARHHHGK